MKNTALNQVRRVLIVGGGTAGWMTAAMLARILGEQILLQLVESDSIGTVGVGEATIPAIQHFNAALGINEAEFLRETKGSIKLGIQFENWGRQGDSYMHAFGPVGRQLGMASFHHFWLAAKARGDQSSFWDYSLNYQAAKAGKFNPQSQLPGSPLPGLQYAYHFDAGLYAAFLRRYSEQRGVTRVEGLIAHVEQQPSGDIATVVLTDGRVLAADLFIDCSGLRALLIEQTLAAGYDNWQHWLPCDSALAVPSEARYPIVPFTRSIAHGGGWQWRIPLQHRTGNGLVYSSRFLDDEQAKQTLLTNLDAPALAEPRKISFVTGRRKQQWRHNCVAVGLSSGFLEPLESTSIHLIQSAVVRLVQCFPATRDMVALSAEFNRQSQLEFEAIRDFIILHYHLNQRTDHPLWQYCREMDLPDTLAQRLDLFRQSGQVFRQQDELFTEVAWQQVMLGQNTYPISHHPLAEGLTATQLSGYLSDLQQVVSKTVMALPTHQAYLQNLVGNLS
ncbi:tryptophan halogenase [Alishewanella aestuarii B11]|uniref:Tryptophan halogenase n=1 Tax=Alishewanella aestuarii B11 TaxID=1197174 RepID=J1QM61_9ALTE|nr:tryptophan halogenase family protein [Alishewanella aestuarii]EJI86701.1 tryptophan halogenase [Alishewanella aestuarii B11]